MRVLVSSKAFASMLNKINLNQTSIMEVEANGWELIFTTSQGDTFDIPGEFRGDDRFDVSKRRWDWIKKEVNKMSEQPLTIDFSPDNISITLCF